MKLNWFFSIELVETLETLAENAILILQMVWVFILEIFFVIYLDLIGMGSLCSVNVKFKTRRLAIEKFDGNEVRWGMSREWKTDVSSQSNRVD